MVMITNMHTIHNNVHVRVHMYMYMHTCISYPMQCTMSYMCNVCMYVCVCNTCVYMCTCVARVRVCMRVDMQLCYAEASEW